MEHPVGTMEHRADTEEHPAEPEGFLAAAEEHPAATMEHLCEPAEHRAAAKEFLLAPMPHRRVRMGHRPATMEHPAGREEHRPGRFVRPFGARRQMFTVPRVPLRRSAVVPPVATFGRPVGAKTEAPARLRSGLVGSGTQRFPRFSCSNSSASNSALKLPLPKAWEPRRQMISKKRVGRSCRGLVKSWRR